MLKYAGLLADLRFYYTQWKVSLRINMQVLIGGSKFKTLAVLLGFRLSFSHQ